MAGGMGGNDNVNTIRVLVFSSASFLLPATCAARVTPSKAIQTEGMEAMLRGDPLSVDIG